ncbi:hypothetical protein MTR72_02985 [Bradyrhizobium sp. ISRA442]|uniref:hypothetical protein n=1 Tax=Bradyrhizobium sp. ISRA442 TaxID=2866197 RepID=UPI00311AFC60
MSFARDVLSSESILRPWRRLGSSANVTVLNRQGEVADRLILDGPQPTNCAFALEGKKLRVTEVGKGQVEEIDMPCEGLPLHLPKFA